MRPMIGITCDLDLGSGRDTRAPGRRAHVLYDDYVQAVLASGGVPVLLPASRCDASQAAYAEHLHGLMIPGSPADVDPACYGEEPHLRLGPVNPLRTDFEIQLARLALTRGLPGRTLTVCQPSRGRRQIPFRTGGFFALPVRGGRKVFLCVS